MRENAIPMQQQFISHGENNNISYPSPLTMISGKIENNGGLGFAPSVNHGQIIT